MSTQKAVMVFNFLRIVIEKKRIKIIKLLKKMGKKNGEQVWTVGEANVGLFVCSSFSEAKKRDGAEGRYGYHNK